MKTTNTKRTRCPQKEVVFLPRQFSMQGDDQLGEILDMATATKSAPSICTYQDFLI